MKAGIKYNSTYQILQEGPMEQIILKLSGFFYSFLFLIIYFLEFKFMPIVGLGEFIFQIDCIQRKNYLQSLNFSCLIRLEFF